MALNLAQQDTPRHLENFHTGENLDGLTIDAKAKIGHGQWLPWLEDNFGWTEMTATRFKKE